MSEHEPDPAGPETGHDQVPDPEAAAGKSADGEHDRGEPANKWVEDAEEALSGVGDALRTAWEASRDARMTALEAARRAVEALGDAIDQGLTAARSRKQEQAETPAAPPSPESPVSPTPPPPMGDVEG